MLVNISDTKEAQGGVSGRDSLGRGIREPSGVMSCSVS